MTRSDSPDQELNLTAAAAQGGLTFHDFAKPGAIIFNQGVHPHTREFMRVEPNGDVFVRGEKVDRNVDVYEALKQWLSGATGQVHPDNLDHALELHRRGVITLQRKNDDGSWEDLPRDAGT